jgi:ABC-type sugar transport system ATPase subunit
MNALEVRGISKTYPGVRALDQIAFTCRKGSVHALVGENGAGKSTLIKILSGAVAPDEGELLLDGQPYMPASPSEAAEAGVSTIYQEFNLIPGLNVAENIFLGRERIENGLLDSRSMRKEAQARQSMCADGSVLCRSPSSNSWKLRSRWPYPRAC